jgi:hypothetical protein
MKIFKSVLFALLMYSCQLDHESSKPELKFSSTVGSLIDLDLATRWMKRYDASAAKEQSYSVSLNNFKSLMGTTNKVGIALHYAKDDANTQHILLIPVSETEVLYNSSVILDANGDQVISSGIAKTWIENFKSSSSDAIWYHYFGIQIFDEILATNFSRFEISPAINDEGEGQLLLLVWPAVNGRTKDGSPLVYDMSNPCPPCPPGK